MKLYDRLVQETQLQRQQLLGTDIIRRALGADIVLDDYVAFLSQAYHHVRHTVPLMMATGARLPESCEWMQPAIGEYIGEEMGHQEWILNDIAACGHDSELVRHSRPNPSTEVMVAYAYDMINRVNPLGFFGMVHVLEGTSISIADRAADAIREHLGLPKKAFSYLYSHGALDQDHVKFFENLMNRITDRQDQDLVVHSAQVFFRLYADIFRELGNEQALQNCA